MSEHCNLKWLIIILNGSHEDSPNYDKRQGTADLRSSEEFKQYRQINTRNTIDKDVVGKFKFISTPALEQNSTSTWLAIASSCLNLRCISVLRQALKFWSKRSACAGSWVLICCWHKRSGHGIWYYFGPSKVRALPLKLWGKIQAWKNQRVLNAILYY